MIKYCKVNVCLITSGYSEPWVCNFSTHTHSQHQTSCPVLCMFMVLTPDLCTINAFLFNYNYNLSLLRFKDIEDDLFICGFVVLSLLSQFLFYKKNMFLCSDLINSVFLTLSCGLLHLWSHLEGRRRTKSVPLHVGDTQYVYLATRCKSTLPSSQYVKYKILVFLSRP